METRMESALNLVMQELVEHMERTKSDLERDLRQQGDVAKQVIWNAKYNGRRMNRLATAAQMLESLRKGF